MEDTPNNDSPTKQTQETELNKTTSDVTAQLNI